MFARESWPLRGSAMGRWSVINRGWWLLMGTLFVVGCASGKGPGTLYEELKSLPATQVKPVESLPLATLAREISKDNLTNVILDEKSPVVTLRPGQRTYARVVKIEPSATPTFFEVHSPPYKPLGFGTLRFVDPEVVFLDAKSRRLSNQPERIKGEMTATFVYGKYFRSVWKVAPSASPTYAVITAKTDRIGQQAMTMTNYGAAGVGVVFDQTVQFSPAGLVRVLATDKIADKITDKITK
jgi:hypothetical protein